MAEFDAGTEIAGYRVESVIGRGGMAVVYRAEDTRLGRKVALKLLSPSLAQNEQFQQRFIRESRLAASLDHPNIVPIYEAGESGGHLFIAMRYVPGTDLKGLISHEAPLPPARVMRLFVQIGDALDAAHVLGLVHRDVKPGNILITSVTEHSGHAHPDHVYLTDFGLTKRTSSLSGSLTGTGHFLGTVDYVSPEQIQGAPVGPATDIYALGCVLYECLTGRLPFSRDDDAAVLWAHLVEHPPPVSAIRSELSPAVDAVVARAMAKAPEDRYDSCRDLVRDLEDALSRDTDLSAAGAGVPVARHRGGGVVPDDPTTGETSTTPAPGGPQPGSARTAGPGGDETVGWVSHPSLPPGALAPPGAAATGGPGVAQPGQPDLDDLQDLEEVDEPASWAGWDGSGDEPVPADDETDDRVAAEEWAAVDEEWAPGPGEEWAPAPDEEWQQEQHAPPATLAGAAPASPRRGRWVLLAVAVLVLVLAGVATVLWLQSRPEGTKAFASQTALIQFSLRHPDSWTSIEDGINVVISPAPDAMRTIFLDGESDPWAQPREVLASRPEDARGVYATTQGSAPGESTEELREFVTNQLAQAGLVKVDLGSTHQQPRIGGLPGHEFEATLSDPQAPGTRLHSVVDVVLHPSGVAMFVLFAPSDGFEGERPTLVAIRDSIAFPG